MTHCIERGEFWRGICAERLGEWTAGVKPAPRGRIDRVGRIARDRRRLGPETMNIASTPIDRTPGRRRSRYFVNNAKAPFQSSGGGFFRYPTIRVSYRLYSCL